MAFEAEDSRRGDVFISMVQGQLHERKGIRQDGSERYLLEVRLPKAGEWNIYLLMALRKRVTPGMAESGYQRTAGLPR